MATKIYVDGIMQVWGDRLFYAPVKAKTGAQPLLSPNSLKNALKKNARQGGNNGSGGSVQLRKKLDATIKKTPEVMVKITSSGKNIKQIKTHLDYISRNGEVELENQDGDEIQGKEAVRDVRDEWKDGKYVIPTGEGTQRESFNIMLSMPPGTDRKAVKDAVRDFAKDEFGGRYDYVFAAHDDEKHPHVHLVVKARGYDGKRLNPRKADLQDWRESFAEKLREHGIEANATKRPTRGVTKVPSKQSVIHMRKRGHDLPFAHDPNHNPDNPYAAKTAETRKKVIQAYGEIAKALAQSGSAQDRATALKVVELVQTMPATKITDEQRKQRQQDKDTNKGRRRSDKER
jgi:hypothetical protein